MNTITWLDRHKHVLDVQLNAQSVSSFINVQRVLARTVFQNGWLQQQVRARDPKMDCYIQSNQLLETNKRGIPIVR